MRFRGRELAHQEFGIRLLERIRGDLEPHGVVEQWPKMEGRQLVMVLAPKVKPVQAKPAPKPPREGSGGCGENREPKAKPPATGTPAAAAEARAAAPADEDKK